MSKLMGISFASLLLLCIHPLAQAQQPAPKEKKSSAAKVETQRVTLAGIASKLGTTPDVLQGQWTAARTANPTLKFGQFVGATVIARNLGPTHPKVTTAAILAGVKNGSTVTKTLEALGLSVADAKKARADAREAEAEAERYSAAPVK